MRSVHTAVGTWALPHHIHPHKYIPPLVIPHAVGVILGRYFIIPSQPSGKQSSDDVMEVEHLPYLVVNIDYMVCLCEWGKMCLAK